MSSDSRRERLLLVDKNPQDLQEKLKEWLLSRYDISIHTASSGLEAIHKFPKYNPALILINCDLPDMHGMTLSSIIKDGQDGRDYTVYLYNVSEFLQNAKADYYMLKNDDANKVEDTMRAQITVFYENRFMRSQHSMEIMRAKSQQYKFLPQTIKTKHYQTTNVFASYGELSGDSFDYWTDEEGNLYGLLFDCVGHDIISYSQVREIRTLLKKDMKLFELGVQHQNLSDILCSVNSDLFAVERSPEMTACILFKVDIKTGWFHFCTAGMPGIFLQKSGQTSLSEKECSNFLLGTQEGVTFDDEVLSLEDIDKLIVCSDGFYEVTCHPDDVYESRDAKHDDISAVIFDFTSAIQAIAKANPLEN